jgi:hypothetical protein
MRSIPIFLWIAFSLIWVVGILMLRPPIIIQIDYKILIFYCLLGPIVVGGVLLLLYVANKNFFRSLVTASPLGAVFVAMFGLFGYLITAERETRRPFLEKQLDGCVKLAEAAEALVASAELEERSRASKRFWVEVWDLAIFSNDELERAIKDFGDLERLKGDDLHDAARCVERMCRVMVHASWPVLPGLVRDKQKLEPSCVKKDEILRQLKNRHLVE